MKKQYEQAFSNRKSTLSTLEKRPLSASGKKTRSERNATVKAQSFTANNKSIRTEPEQAVTLESPGRSQLSTASQSVTKINSTGGIVKTVILPYDEINNIKTELEYLKDYKARQKSLYEEAIQGYQKDKVIRLQEFQLKEKDMQETITALQGRIKHTEEEGYQMSKDFFQYKHQIQKSRDQMTDERELLNIERMAL